MPERDKTKFIHIHQRGSITDWQPVDAKKLPAELVEKIGRKGMPCPLCNDRGMVIVTYESPSMGKWFSDKQLCPCGFPKQFFTRLLETIPVHYQYAMLKTLQPSEKSLLPLDYQVQLLKELREHPEDSYAFFGPAGTSKTTFSAALYRRALFEDMRQRHFTSDARGTACWRITVKQLTDECVAFATAKDFKDDDGVIHRAKEPTVNRRKIVAARRAGYRPRLFLEEIDKMKGSEFKQQELFDVLNGLYEADGQLVMNTNMTPEEFSREFGAAFERRIAEMCRVKDFFGVTV